MKLTILIVLVALLGVFTVRQQLNLYQKSDRISQLEAELEDSHLREKELKVELNDDYSTPVEEEIVVTTKKPIKVNAIDSISSDFANLTGDVNSIKSLVLSGEKPHLEEPSFSSDSLLDHQVSIDSSLPGPGGER